MPLLANYLENLQRFGIKPGLERIRALLESAGNPQNHYPILLIGGTNGKGSTCEFAARLLSQNERKIGLYTSPHLYHWNERIRVLPGAGLFEGAISDADLDALLEAALPHIEAVAREFGQPTEFEVMTFLGLWHFARQKVDGAVVEVGLGGKWDATNVTEPLVSVVTHVALDHMDRLGNTLELIAADKVEIARSGQPFLTAETKENVLKIFRAHCERIGAPIHYVSRNDSARERIGFDFQRGNLTLATCATLALQKQLGWEHTTNVAHLFGTQVVGRTEKIGNMILDGANNPDGAQVLAGHISQKLQIAPENLVLVLGILADKNWREMTQILAPLAKTVIVTRSNSPRAMPTLEIAAVARENCSYVEEIAPVEAAVERAKALAGPDDVILVTGSFTTIAQVPRATY